jgi:cell division septation protein DedD
MPTMITFQAGRAALAAALLTVAAGCSGEQQDWRSAEAAGTTEAYQRFLEQHPDSELSGKARERVGEFVEDRDWSQASKIGTPDAYRGFLAAHPNGRWSQEARIRVESFALGSIPRMEQAPGQTASRPAGVKLLRLASASPTVPAAALAGSAPSASPGASPGPAPAAGSARPAPHTPTPKGYAIQLGAFASEASARREWQRLQSRFRAQLSGLTPQVVPGGTASGQLYRLQAPAAGESQARAICDSLKARLQPCVPVLPR